MAATKRRLSLPAPGLEFLLAELDAVGRSTPRARLRQAGRLAVTFRPARRGRDGLPDHPIPFDAFRLLAVAHGRPDARRRRVVLGIFRPALNPLAPGRIRFLCEQSHDLTRPRTLTRPRPNATAIRSAIALHQAVDDADPADFVPGLRLPDFFCAFDPHDAPDFDPAEFPDAGAAEVAIDGLRAWPAEWFARDGGRLFRAHRPTRIFASLAHLKGRRVRNPAFSTLKSHGLLPRGQGYRAWLGSVSRLGGRDRIFQDPRDERTEAGRLRRAIEDHVTAEPAREAALLADLEAACIAMGVRMPDGPGRADALAALLDNPWDRPSVHYAGAIQLLGPAGSRDAAAMSFSDGASEINLADLQLDRDLPGGAPTAAWRR